MIINRNFDITLDTLIDVPTWESRVNYRQSVVLKQEALYIDLMEELDVEEEISLLLAKKVLPEYVSDK